MYVPTLAEIELLVETGDQSDPVVAMRSAAIATLYATAAEIQHVLALAWSDRAPLGDAAILLRFTTSDGTQRETPVLAAAATISRHEQLSPPLNPSAPMFATAGRRLQYRSLDRELTARAATLGLPGRVPLSALRSARIRDLMDSGMSLEDVSDLIGIVNLNTVLHWRKRIIASSDPLDKTGKR